jgi:transposase-like protein
MVLVEAGLLARLEARIEELEAEVARLRRLAGLDSSNSSRPPSTDGLGKAPVKSLRGKSGRRPGGQKGHRGSGLKKVADPDVVVVHRPQSCSRCGRGFAGGEPSSGDTRACQVFDLPVEVKVEVTEHRMESVCCPGCGTSTRAEAPPGAEAWVSWGPRIQALAVYLVAVQMLPVRRVADTIEAVCRARVSTGWVASLTSRAGQATSEANRRAGDLIAEAPWAHFDESVVKVGGRRQWFHVAATDDLTCYHADQSGRSLESIKAFGILPRFGGVAVHDGYAAYDSAGLRPADLAGVADARCAVHVLRELRGVDEFDPAAAADGWAAELDDLIGDGFRWRQAWSVRGFTGLPDFKLDDFRRRWDELVGRGLAAHPHQPGRPGGQSHARRLAVRLHEHAGDHQRWLEDFTIPATNNEAERAVRMIKTKTKVSGGFRTLAGLQDFLAVRAHIDSLRKNGQNLLDRLHDALTGHSWTPQPAPT